MRIEEVRKRAAKLLYEVTSGQITAGQAIADYPDVKSADDESLVRGLHALYHFGDDDDVRERDKAYADRQTEALRAMADRLAQGLPLTQEHSYW